MVEAAYSGASSRDMSVSRQMDAAPDQYRATARETFLATGRNTLNDSFANPFFGLITNGTLAAATVTRNQLLRPYPHFTSINELNSSIGTSRYDSFQLKANKRLSQGLSMLVSYTASKQLDRVRYLNETDEHLYNALPTFDTPQRLVVSATYELPFGPGKPLLAAKGGAAVRLLEGWQLNVIYSANGGIPLSISGAETVGRTAKLSSDLRTLDRWFDTSAVRQRQTLELTATSLSPDVRSHGRNTFDISMFKTAALMEKLRLQFRAESFNTMNRPEYSAPDTTFGGPNFGRISTTNIFARQLQFGLRLLW